MRIRRPKIENEKPPLKEAEVIKETEINVYEDMDTGDIAAVDEADQVDYDYDDDYTEEDLSDVETGEVVDLVGGES